MHSINQPRFNEGSRIILPVKPKISPADRSKLNGQRRVNNTDLSSREKEYNVTYLPSKPLKTRTVSLAPGLKIDQRGHARIRSNCAEIEFLNNQTKSRGPKDRHQYLPLKKVNGKIKKERSKTFDAGAKDHYINQIQYITNNFQSKKKNAGASFRNINKCFERACKNGVIKDEKLITTLGSKIPTSVSITIKKIQAPAQRAASNSPIRKPKKEFKNPFIDNFLEDIEPKQKTGHEKTLRSLSKRFNVLQVLGTGVYSIIYVAKDKQNNSLVALKMGMAHNGSLLKEYQCLKMMNHRNIAKAYGYLGGSSGIDPVIIMEYAGSQTIQQTQTMKTNNVFPEATVLVFAHLIIDALSHAHSKCIAHCDIKGDNIIVDLKSMKLKIIDWGFSGVYKNQVGGFYCGTPNYMSPQLLARKAFSPFKADVWALGVMLFKLLFNTFPYIGKSEGELLYKIKTTRINFTHTSGKCGLKIQKLISSMLVVNEEERADIFAVQTMYKEFFTKDL